jgi:phosphatidylglycerol:prolipoprotein diacylglycerol transferase
MAIIKRLSRGFTPDPQLVTNGALYALIAGVIGARLFYVIHYFETFKDDLLSIFAVWRGGLEQLGGAIAALAVIIFYIRRHKLPIRRYLDVIAVGLFFAIAFGRIGCFLNGCCFGKPTELPWAVRFPYNSFAYRSQVQPDPARNRFEPQLGLSPKYFEEVEENGRFHLQLIPVERLTSEQIEYLKATDKFRTLPVHPTQLYDSANAVLCGVILFFLWRRDENLRSSTPENAAKISARPGFIFSLMFIFYGVTRFLLEFLRDDNPYEFDSLTVSQNLSILMVILGLVLLTVFSRIKKDFAKIER